MRHWLLSFEWRTNRHVRIKVESISGFSDEIAYVRRKLWIPYLRMNQCITFNFLSHKSRKAKFSYACSCVHRICNLFWHACHTGKRVCIGQSLRLSLMLFTQWMYYIMLFAYYFSASNLIKCLCVDEIWTMHLIEYNRSIKFANFNVDSSFFFFR